MQKKQNDWYWQWSHLNDGSAFLFNEWIFPRTIEDFRDKVVVDAGCGGGQHTGFVSPVAKQVFAVDLNTTELAKKHNSAQTNIQYIEGDLATITLPEKADIVFCVGVIHHTDNPDATFRNLLHMLKPGGLILVWCYSREGNFLNERILEPLKRAVLLRLPKPTLLMMAHLLTLLMYPIIYSIYLLPLTFLPYYEYFINWRKLRYRRNVLNVFDKLNAPQTHFITKERITSWFDSSSFDDITIRAYRGVSWHGSGRLRY